MPQLLSEFVSKIGPALKGNVEQLDKSNAGLGQVVWGKGILEEQLKIEISAWEQEFRQDIHQEIRT
jgi:hypothetical protein